MGEDLQDYLFFYKQAQDERKEKLGHGWRNTEKVLDKTTSNTKIIIGGDFINRKENGELMTVNSIKYWGRELAKIGIEFKYHSPRRTHATMMAAANTPVIELQQRLGHKKFDTTMKYYIDTNIFAKERLKENVKGLTNFFVDGLMVVSSERKQELLEEGLLDKEEFAAENIPLPSERAIYGEMGFSSEAEFEEAAEQKVEDFARSITELINKLNKSIEDGSEDLEDY